MMIKLTRTPTILPPRDLSKSKSQTITQHGTLLRSLEILPKLRLINFVLILRHSVFLLLNLKMISRKLPDLNLVLKTDGSMTNRLSKREPTRAKASPLLWV